ncbi:MAG: phosphatase [Blautia sp.]|nr:phosphatase [Blautia sp.]
MYLSDLHTHSIASGHGTRCTVQDMARAASEKGLKLLGITDHGPATSGAGTPSYFRSLACSPRERFGIELLYGVELNLMDREGTVDLPEELLSRMDYAILSMHIQNYRPGTREENTRALMEAMRRHPGIKILGHCDDARYPVDYAVLARAARENHVIFEINEASLAPDGYRGDTRKQDAAILESSLKEGLPVLLSSDSHGTEKIGDFTFSSEFVHGALFPEEQILNNRLSFLRAFLLDR